MNRSGSDDKAIVCPFYRGFDPYRISCEGVTEDSSIKVTFGNPEKAKAYKDCFCRDIDGYRRCRISEMLMGKYADEK